MTKSKSFLLWLILLAAAFPLHAQEDETQDGEEDLFNKTIDTAMAISPQYLPTSYTLCGGMFFHPVDYKEIDTTMNQTDFILRDFVFLHNMLFDMLGYRNNQ